jgi:hypothetical protein
MFDYEDLHIPYSEEDEKPMKISKTRALQIKHKLEIMKFKGKILKTNKDR